MSQKYHREVAKKQNVYVHISTGTLGIAATFIDIMRQTMLCQSEFAGNFVQLSVESMSLEQRNHLYQQAQRQYWIYNFMNKYLSKSCL